jgi:tRNA(Ile2) C34 agmatinyltransferase TiaS
METRGNGALCLRFITITEFEQTIKETAIELWEEHSRPTKQAPIPA